jgi:hypothetical protein
MSKSSKTAIAAASGFILLLLMLYFTFYFTPHDKILDAEYNSWLDNKFKPQVIKGVVKSFEAYNDKDEFHDLEIQNGDEKIMFVDDQILHYPMVPFVSTSRELLLCR